MAIASSSSQQPPPHRTQTPLWASLSDQEILVFPPDTNLENGVTPWVRLACHHNDVPELAQAIAIEWNHRFTRRLGDAIFNPTTYQSKIRLSIPLWPRASFQDKRETVIHEACHLIVWHKFGLFVKAHGPEWKQAMKNCGVQPLRTHEVDRTGLARRQRLFILKDCPNEMKCRMSVREFNQIQRETVMECKVCGLVVKTESAIELDNSKPRPPMPPTD